MSPRVASAQDIYVGPGPGDLAPMATVAASEAVWAPGLAEAIWAHRVVPL